MERKWLSVLVSFTEQYNTLKTSPISVHTVLRSTQGMPLVKEREQMGKYSKRESTYSLIQYIQCRHKDRAKAY